MAGDKEKCLAAGMDDYISKPFRMQDLVTVIKKTHLDNMIPPRLQESAESFPDDKILLPLIFKRVGRDKKVLRECLNLLRTEITSAVQEINAALISNDNEKICYVCHGLRGALLALDIQEAAKTAAKIEMLATEQKPNEIKQYLSTLNMQVLRSADYLERYINTNQV